MTSITSVLLSRNFGQCSHAVCATWLSDDAAFHDERANRFECDDGDGDDAHGSEDHV
jgi:hypothetical protein